MPARISKHHDARPLDRTLSAAFFVAVLLTVTVASCHSSSPGPSNKKDGGGEGGLSCGHDGGAKAANGAACACAADCASGFCADGVCCNTACTETCKSCDTKSAPGTCSFVAAGDAPRTADVCPKSAVGTCGLDGTCDGKGSCRAYTAGTVCQAGACSGASLQGVRVCDGAGSCVTGAAKICAPFNCDPTTAACRTQCASDSDCAPNISA